MHACFRWKHSLAEFAEIHNDLRELQEYPSANIFSSETLVKIIFIFRPKWWQTLNLQFSQFFSQFSVTPAATYSIAEKQATAERT
jgi:hypothetical protein